MSGHRLDLVAQDTGERERFFRRFTRVGLRGALTDANRAGRRVAVPAEAAVEGFCWNAADSRSRRWWPQGITTSADAYGADGSEGVFDGRAVALTSWYARGPFRAWLGSRITVVDGVGGPGDVRYRHVLLVEPSRRWGVRRLRAVRVHAGGIVWYGDHLFVAGGPQGIRVFRLDDLLRVRNRSRSRGYRYVLPQHAAYVTSGDGDAMVYSFMSVDRGADLDHLVVGEYGRKGGTHRLMRYAIDRTSGMLRRDDQGLVAPTDLHDRQVERMQGAALAGDTWFITASMGEGNPGDLWTGEPDRLTRHRGVLPTGPEDITHWPQRRQLWTLTEWPGRRWVYAIDPARWEPGPRLDRTRS